MTGRMQRAEAWHRLYLREVCADRTVELQLHQLLPRRLIFVGPTEYASYQPSEA